MKTLRFFAILCLVVSQSTKAQETSKPFELKPYDHDAWIKEEVERLEIEHPAKPKEYWEQKIEKVEIGMTRREVLEILGSYAFPSPTSLTGGANCRTYHLDKKWSWGVCYDNSGRSELEDPMYDRLLEKREISEMGWEVTANHGYRGEKYLNQAAHTTSASAPR